VIPPRRRWDHRGFTLIEMIVVIVIMSLIAGMVLVRRPWHSSGLDLDATQRALTGALRLARSRAIAQDRAVTVVTNAAGFSVDGGALRALPAGETLSAAQVVFTPDGEASGGTIVLSSASTRIGVTVNWLTGKVSARELAVQ
jgi:general secretion pathway protein H